MPVVAELHDGRRLEFPDGTDPAIVQATVRRVLGVEPERSPVVQQAANVAGGLVRGAGSIGATLLAPIDIASDALAGKGLTLESNRQRRADMDAALHDLVGADPNSFAYGAGKLASEVAGTAGVGGALANTAARIPGVAAAAPNLLTAIRSGGMMAGPTTGTANALLRLTGGAVTGGTSAALVDPQNAARGAVAGAALPGVAVVGAKAGEALRNVADQGAERLMQSAVKPTLDQLRTGQAATAVQTLLDYGINPTKAGVNKLRALIDDLNARISDEIGASTATVDKQNVLGALADTRTRFGNQVSPTADLNAIQRVADDFLAHPNLPGNVIPVQAAQEMKKGTYRVLSDKYGEIGSAETEAQKALARGLKDEISAAVPAVAPLNAEESRLLATLSVAERRALMDANKNPMGLAALAHNPVGWAAFMADRSAAFKALAARLVNRMTPAAGATSQGLLGAAENPLVRNAALLSVGTTP